MIRPRRDSDIEACVRVLDAVQRLDGYPARRPDDRAGFLAVPDALGAWVAEDGGEVVGHVVLRERTSPPVMALAVERTGLAPARLAVVGRLLVAPSARRRGFGRGLLEAAVARAADLGRCPVLDVVREHLAAVALYEHAGWRRLGEVSVTWSNGRGADEVVYAAPAGPGPLS